MSGLTCEEIKFRGACARVLCERLTTANPSGPVFWVSERASSLNFVALGPLQASPTRFFESSGKSLLGLVLVSFADLAVKSDVHTSDNVQNARYLVDRRRQVEINPGWGKGKDTRPRGLAPYQ